MLLAARAVRFEVCAQELQQELLQLEALLESPEESCSCAGEPPPMVEEAQRAIMAA